MNTVPLDLQRRCEQRWAARYRGSQEAAATPEHQLQKSDQQLAAPGQGQNESPPSSAGASEFAPAARVNGLSSKQCPQKRSARPKPPLPETIAPPPQTLRKKGVDRSPHPAGPLSLG
jgi:hypothetical protein